MIIGFLGKGGSGKTTLATLFTKYLLADGNAVLAIDNDHNMDFKYNLGHENEMNYIGQSLSEIFEAMNIKNTKEVIDLEDEFVFSLSPLDKLTEKYSVQMPEEKLRLMVAGPHTKEMMDGLQCSHGLTVPLKAYLPFLKLNEDEYCVVDEKAGTDGVGTGITTGWNAAVVVAEATPHGVKSAKQIISMLKFYNTPYAVIINKVRDESEVEKYKTEFNCSTIIDFTFDTNAYDLKLADEYKNKFDILKSWLDKLSDDRKERTRVRVERQIEASKTSI
jgi:CO dehydrogenase maturation factor